MLPIPQCSFRRRSLSDTTSRFVGTGLLILLLTASIVFAPRELRAQPQLVADRFTASVPDPDGLADVGSPYGLCFQGDTKRSLDGNERVLCYDGSRLRQVTGAVGGAFEPNITRYDGDVYFGAFGADGLELYRYDGSTVEQVADINPSGDAEPRDLTVYDDGGASGADLYFSATDGTDGRELWRYTSGQGVSRVVNLNSSGDGIQRDDNRLFRIYDDGGSSGPDLYFSATNGADGIELWRYESGSSVQQVTDINPSGDARPANFAVYDDGGSSGPDLYFRADDGNRDELWRYESGGGASLVADVSLPRDLTVYDDGTSSGGDLYFEASGGGGGSRLWRYSSGSGATQVDIAGANGSSPRGLTVYNDGSGADLYFSANDGTDGTELWRYESGAGATQVTDINPGGDNSSPQDLAVYDGTLYFRAKEDALSRELWSYDGTVSKVRFDNNLEGGPEEKVAYDGALYFRADDRRSGREDGAELWRYEPGSGLSEAADINPSGGSRPQDFAVYDDGGSSGADLYFKAYDGINGDELWRFDAGSGADRVTDINTSGDSEVKYLTVYDDGGASGADLYFRANDGTSGRELWRHESGSGASQIDINSSGGSFPRDLVVYDDGGASGPDLYFAAGAGTDGNELWRYDSGTSAAQVADINAGSGDSFPSSLTVFDDGGARVPTCISVLSRKTETPGSGGTSPVAA